MLIRGFQPFSLIDYPGKISCIVFTGNCNLRCPYCHNPSLVFDPESQPEYPLPEFWDFLARRQGRLDGVVISGGGPTVQQGLAQFIAQIKGMGFMVKLDTNGTHPKTIEDIHQLCGIDYLAIDYKAPAEKYSSTVFSAPGMSTMVQESISYAVKNEIAMEIRTTVHRSLLSADDIRQMREELNEIGAGLWYLQQFNNTALDLLDESLTRQETYTDHELVMFAEQVGGQTFARGLNGTLLKHRSIVRGESQNQLQT